jgi:hypothetical protein
MANPILDDDGRQREPQTDSKEASRTQSGWREKFPGWDTVQGNVNNPAKNSSNPTLDPRFDTRNGLVVRRPGPVVLILLVTLGVLLFLLLAFFMYQRFQTPSPRSPETPQAQMQILDVGRDIA